jgi:phosphatidylglycerophosphatase A
VSRSPEQVSRPVLPLLLATWFGCGYFPWAPGSIGSAVAVLLAACIEIYFGSGRLLLLVLILFLMAPAIWSATHVARFFGKTDPGAVVIDEVLGQWTTLLGASAKEWKVLLAGFVLFRVFDIWKPWPIRNLERLPQGIGIVMDDISAGLYGALILYVGRKFRLY